MLIKASYVVTMSEREKDVLKDVYIGIDDNGRIEYIGKKRINTDEVLDLTGRIIIPGLINAHTHIAMTILRGLKDDVNLNDWLNKYIFPAEATLKDEDVFYGALYGIAESLESGVTTFADMYIFEEKIADAVAISGVRANLSRGIIDLDKTVEDALKQENYFLSYVEKFWSKDPNLRYRIVYSYGPHAPYTCSAELLKQIKDLSIKTGYGVQIHLSETRWEYEKIKKERGMTPIEYLHSLGLLSNKLIAAHVVWTSERDLALLKQSKVNVVHNPSSNLKLASGIARITDMLRMGINVALGTDGPASNNRLDMLWEMRLTALLHKGISLDPLVLTAKEVLKMATINGAKALGMDRFIGSIEEGKFADLVVINPKKVLQGTPMHDIYSMIVYALDIRAIERVIVGGKTLYHEGKFETIDINKIRSKIVNIRNRIENAIS